MVDYMQQVEAARQATGLPESYLLITPSAFWTPEAFNLFREAHAAGIIECVWELDTWGRGPGKPLEALRADLNSDQYAAPSQITKGQLAYFCKRASLRLHLNNGAHTNWRPFEQMFGFAPGTMRRYLHNVEERDREPEMTTKGQYKLKDPYIDAFFDKVTPYK